MGVPHPPGVGRGTESRLAWQVVGQDQGMRKMMTRRLSWVKVHFIDLHIRQGILFCRGNMDGSCREIQFELQGY